MLHLWSVLSLHQRPRAHAQVTWLSASQRRAAVHRPPSQAPCPTGQLSHQFCRSSPSSFSLRVTCTHLTVVLGALLSVLSFVAASWLKVKESIISLWKRSTPVPEPCVWKCCGYNIGSCEFDTATVPAGHRQDLRIGSKHGDLANSRLSRNRSEWQMS